MSLYNKNKLIFPKKKDTIEALRCLVYIKPVHYSPGPNLIISDVLQPSPLKPSIQSYVQFPSRVPHMLPTHVSQRCSLLTPYVPVVHSENVLLYAIYTDNHETYTQFRGSFCWFSQNLTYWFVRTNNTINVTSCRV
jgi:hypothetical protein